MKNFIIKQEYSLECGIACLATLFTYHGVKCSLEECRNLLIVSFTD